MSVICAVLVSYMSSQKVIYISRLDVHSTITCVPNSFSIRRKHFAGNFSACVITNNENN